MRLGWKTTPPALGGGSSGDLGTVTDTDRDIVNAAPHKLPGSFEGLRNEPL